LTLQTPTEVPALDRAEVESLAAPQQSLMPEGLADGLSAAEFRDLIGYLMSRSQVPLPNGRLDVRRFDEFVLEHTPVVVVGFDVGSRP
jgi:hypothetical protein